MDKQIRDMIALFHKDKALHYEIKELSFDANDSRWVIFVDFSEEKSVIKIAANGFTSKKHRRFSPYTSIFPA